MAKTAFTNLKLKVNSEVKTIDFKDTQIEVSQYLPIEDKMNIINMTLQNSEISAGIYDITKLYMYFDLYVIYSYTNISFTDKQRENEYKLYDMFKSNGLVEEIIKTIPEAEYSELNNLLFENEYQNEKHKNNITYLVRSFIEDMPKNAEAASEIVKNFDPSQYQAVIDFARAANGGREIE